MAKIHDGICKLPFRSDWVYEHWSVGGSSLTECVSSQIVDSFTGIGEGKSVSTLVDDTRGLNREDSVSNVCDLLSAEAKKELSFK